MKSGGPIYLCLLGIGALLAQSFWDRFVEKPEPRQEPELQCLCTCDGETASLEVLARGEK
jgi:hypothetical protein